MSNSAHKEPNSGTNGSPSEAELSERRDRLNRLLDDRREVEKTVAARQKANNSGFGQATKISSEFIAGILVGGGIGWIFDQWLGTSPFGLIVFLLLGFAAGVLNVLRSTGYVAEAETKIRPKQPDDGSK